MVVYNTSTNPFQYSVATLKRSGLRDIDISKSFSAMVRKKINLFKQSRKVGFPITPETLFEDQDKGPLQDLYNLIYLTVYGTCKIDAQGYAITKGITTKIWSLAKDWQNLITGKNMRNM